MIYNNGGGSVPSRMDRYHKGENRLNRRTEKNAQLYKDIYHDGQYSNIEAITNISRPNEIDLQKLKEMLQKNEEVIKEKKYKKINSPNHIYDKEKIVENKNYDLKEMIEQAKTETKEDNSHHSLKQVDYEFLKSLTAKNIKASDSKNSAEEELADIIHTITNTNILKGMGDQDLSLNMLSELKSTKNTFTNQSGDLKKIIHEELEKSREQRITKKEKDLEQTFFTTGHNFRAEDFESLDESLELTPKEHKIRKVFLILLFIVVLVSVIYLIIKMWK